MEDVKIYAEEIEDEARRQVEELAALRPFKGQRIRVMPDAHAGIGCVVGLTSTFGDAVIPNVVGVDISCGVNAYLIGKRSIDFQTLDDVVRERIPSGMSWREEEQRDFSLGWDDLACIDRLHDLDRIKRSVGTLGGGNHFIELDVDDLNLYAGVLHCASKGKERVIPLSPAAIRALEEYLRNVHSGSRNLGSQVCGVYQRSAHEELSRAGIQSAGYLKDGFIERLKADGKQELIGYVLQTMNGIQREHSVGKELAWVEGKMLEEYLNDCDFCQTYASANRETMAREIFSGMGWGGWDDMVSSTHNYVDTANRIIRKGAIAAYEGQKVIIPLNMAKGCVIGIGKGNEDYNWSAPHGAGRKMSRAKAKRSLRVKDYREQMDGVWSSCIGSSTLDEAPGAYKDADKIIESVAETVDVVQVMRPVYNFKAEEEAVPPWKK